MARDDKDSQREPERKRNGSGPSIARGEQKAAGFNPRRGRSGYGVESIRPHLRAQLEQQKLLRPTFPPEEDDPRSNPHLDRKH